MFYFNKISMSIVSVFLILFSSLAIAQNSDTDIKSDIDVQSINNKPIIDSYTNQTPQQTKTIFTYNNGKTQISESKEYGHFERDINLKGAMGSYKLSKPLNGAISDEKSKRISSVPLIKF